MIQISLVISWNTFFSYCIFEKIESYLHVAGYEQYLHINKALLETLKNNLTETYFFQKTFNLSFGFVCSNMKNYWWEVK